MRPPGRSRSHAAGSARSSEPSSSLTAIRIAWNVRLAGWPPPNCAGVGTARLIAATSSVVVSIGGVVAAAHDLARDRCARSAPRRSSPDHAMPAGARATRSRPCARRAAASGPSACRAARRTSRRSRARARRPASRRCRGPCRGGPPAGPRPPARAARRRSCRAEARGARGLGREGGVLLGRVRVAVDAHQLARRADPLGDQARVAARRRTCSRPRLRRAGVEGVDQLAGQDRNVQRVSCQEEVSRLPDRRCADSAAVAFISVSSAAPALAVPDLQPPAFADHRHVLGEVRHASSAAAAASRGRPRRAAPRTSASGSVAACAAPRG